MLYLTQIIMNINTLIDSLGLSRFIIETYLISITLIFTLVFLFIININKIFTISNLLRFSIFCALVFLGYIGNTLYCARNTDNYNDLITTLLPSIGIVFASFIASASVIKSIKSNEDIKKIEHDTEYKSRLLYMTHVLSDLQAVYKTYSLLTNTFLLNENNTRGLQKAIKESVVDFEKINQDKYFIFLVDSGYQEFQLISKNIYLLNDRIHSNITLTNPDNFFIQEAPIYLKEIQTNIAKLIELLTKEK